MEYTVSMVRHSKVVGTTPPLGMEYDTVRRGAAPPPLSPKCLPNTCNFQEVGHLGGNLWNHMVKVVGNTIRRKRGWGGVAFHM